MTSPIATVAEITSYGDLGSGASAQTVLTEIVSDSMAAIGSYCNRDFSSSSRTEYRDGNDAARMLLVGYPIESVQSVTVDGNPIPQSVNRGNGYFFTGRSLILIGYKFNRGLRNVVIDYTAGYGGSIAWPLDLKMAFILYCVTRFRERQRLGIGSASMAGQSVTFDAPSGTSGGSQGIPSAAKLVFDNYMNTVPESGT